MNTRLMTVALVLFGMAVPFTANAADPASNPSDVSAKEMKDLPGTKGGATANPTAKPDDGSLSSKEMKDRPGIQTGTTSDPTIKPDDGSISSTVKKNSAN